jgi:hypothetical protein
MYIQTDNTGWPFYGYSNNGGTSMWTYWNGGTGTWSVNNSGDRLQIQATLVLAPSHLLPNLMFQAMGD